MRPDLAPGHVERIAGLARDGFYDGVVFHRVIPGFMAQGGDPTGTGMGGSKLPDLKAEFNDEPHVRGTCSMARAQNPNSANSQFFICFDDAGFLDNQYTVWGQVESGMEYVDALPVGEPPREPGQDRQGDGRLMTEPVALITGASAGLGVDFARQLSAKGKRLVLVARRKDRLDALAAELGNARAVEMDLSEPGAADRLMADLAAHGEQVELLVNNAGFGLTGRFAELDGKRQRQMIDLNCGALTELAHAVLPGDDRAQVGRRSSMSPRPPPSSPGPAWPSISRPRPSSCRSARRCTRK